MKSCAASTVGGCPQLPAMRLHNGTADGQPHAAALRLGGAGLLSPTEPAALKRQGAYSLAGSSKDSITHRGENRRQSRFAKAGRCVVSLAPVNFDFWYLPHPHKWEVIKV